MSEGKVRIVVIGIEDICNLFKDYCGMTGFPADAQADTLLMNKGKGKMCLRVLSPSYSPNEEPEEIRFDLQRTHLL